ncbi:MAG TPA: methyltransferase domain-containing protein [Stackebrandtia sp.]|jgi:SAM-dependent methyltransferase|uniref:methyltransferase domain-containing protein n=1 Tax=Stackebrandtia sp. TaxID=2023065 RepID=UPI002D58BAFC|nr:methyltransferase domain-containing protein [Stackebrandtia sp.]HZE40666.1 methyltransferase domain-containing protein [Stackebrandtia sp.]
MLNSRSKALHRTLDLLRQPPRRPDIGQGFLDLLPDEPSEASMRVQRLWTTSTGVQMYTRIYDLPSALTPPWLRDIHGRLELAPGDTVLDLGSGPGNISRMLSRQVGDEGLVVGVDISRPMLQRAVTSTDADNVVFTRGDATSVAFADGVFDAVCCVAMLQLVPDPSPVYDEIARVLAPGGRATIITTGRAGTLLRPVTTLLEWASQARMFGPDEIPDALAQRGLTSIRSRTIGLFEVVHARKPR